MSSVPIPPCLLCSHPKSSIVDRLSGAEIRTLWKTHGDTLSADAFVPIHDTLPVELFRCENCGFRYFDPSLAGGPKFYQELAAQGYYPTTSPEFDDVVAFAVSRGIHAVFDIGCGHGAFLDLAKSKGLQTSGLELTPSAAEVCNKNGHTVRLMPLAEFVASNFPQQPMVTLFQVLEHVSDPVAFLTQAAQITASGGYLVVAVPYDSGVNRLAGMVPHQWPPHHLTRWRHCDLQSLGKKIGLRPVSQKANSIAGSELRRYLRLDRQLRKALPSPRPALPAALITALGWLYTLTGGPLVWPRLGANTTVIFQKP